jgi:hypothetical protein
MDAIGVEGSNLFTSQSINKYCYEMGGIAESTQYHKTIYKVCLHIMIQNVSQSSLLVDGKKVPQLKEQSAHQHPEVSSIFRALSDDKSLTLFNTVALSPGNSDLLTRNLNLTRKQYYSKIERLSKQGLLARKNGKYYLTTMGKIMYELQNVVGIAVNDYWKLKSLDSVIAEKVLPEEELAKLINTLVENEGLRDIILKR